MSTTMVSVKLAYIYENVDRHGNVRVYFWRGRGHPYVRLREPVGSAAFMARYEELRNATAAIPPGRPAITHGTWRWVGTQYLASVAFKRLDPVTQARRRAILERTYDEPVFPGSAETFADFPLSRMTTKALRVLRDRRPTPDSANNTVKVVRAVLKWAINEEHITANPARDLEMLSTPGEGFHCWTVEEIEKFEARHPVGSKARLALALLLYTGARRSDVVQLGRQHMKDGWITFRPHKGRTRHPVIIEIPILAELQEVIDATPMVGSMTFLVTQHGKPFTSNGFGNWFKDRCREAGLPHCSAHGLRKAGATRAAENGATPHALMSIFGWSSVKMAETYTRAVRRKKLASDSMPLLRTKS